MNVILVHELLKKFKKRIENYEKKNNIFITAFKCSDY